MIKTIPISNGADTYMFVCDVCTYTASIRNQMTKAELDGLTHMTAKHPGPVVVSHWSAEQTGQIRLPMEHFSDDDHAIVTGMLLGQLLASKIQAEPVTDDEGNYTPEIILTMPFDPLQPMRCRIRVLPPTPRSD